MKQKVSGAPESQLSSPECCFLFTTELHGCAMCYTQQCCYDKIFDKILFVLEEIFSISPILLHVLIDLYLYVEVSENSSFMF